MSEHLLLMVTLITWTLQKKSQWPDTVADLRLNKRTFIRGHINELTVHLSGPLAKGREVHGVMCIDQGGLCVFVVEL